MNRYGFQTSSDPLDGLDYAETEAYRAGRAAYLAGKPQDGGGLPLGSIDRECWYQGYGDAERNDEAAEGSE